jgi:hypothetical protein
VSTITRLCVEAFDRSLNATKAERPAAKRPPDATPSIKADDFDPTSS